ASVRVSNRCKRCLCVTVRWSEPVTVTHPFSHHGLCRCSRQEMMAAAQRELTQPTFSVPHARVNCFPVYGLAVPFLFDEQCGTAPCFRIGSQQDVQKLSDNAASWSNRPKCEVFFARGPTASEILAVAYL